MKSKKILTDFILSKNYGDLITYKELAELLQLNFTNEDDKKKLKWQMQLVKSIVLDYGYVLKTIAEVGYYILKPKQISGYCYHTYVMKSEKLLEKSEKVLRSTDVTQLSDVRRKEYAEVRQLNRDLIETTNTIIAESEYYTNKDNYDNLKD